jgi:hypothetical protein
LIPKKQLIKNTSWVVLMYCKPVPLKISKVKKKAIINTEKSIIIIIHLGR